MKCDKYPENDDGSRVYDQAFYDRRLAADSSRLFTTGPAEVEIIIAPREEK